MRMIGVSWLRKDWIASVRTTFGLRSTMRASICTIFAMSYGLFGMDVAHDGLAHPVIVPVVGHLPLHLETVHDDDAVGESDHLRHVAGDEKDRRALVGE